MFRSALNSKAKRRCPLLLEQLEDRCVLSVGIIEPLPLTDDPLVFVDVPAVAHQARPVTQSQAEPARMATVSLPAGPAPAQVSSTAAPAQFQATGLSGGGITGAIVALASSLQPQTGAQGKPIVGHFQATVSSSPRRAEPTAGALDTKAPAITLPYLYVSSAGTNQIIRYYESTGTLKDVFVVANSGGLTDPSGLGFYSDGNLYVSSAGTNQVLEYNSAGVFQKAFVTAGSGGLSDPRGLVFGPDGNLYVSSSGTNQVMRYYGPNSTPPPGKKPGDPDPSAGNTGAVFATGNGLNLPQGLAFDSNLRLLVANQVPYAGVLRFKADGTFDTRFIGNDGHLKTPYDISFGPAGDNHFYVSDNPNNAVLQYNLNGIWVSNFATTNVNSPTGIVWDGGNALLFVSDATANNVNKYDANGNQVLPNPFASQGGLTTPTYLIIHG